MEEGLKKKSEPENWFRALVLRDGFKWHSTMVSPGEAQSAELDEAEVRNVARFYRMSPSRLGVKESISYNSEEAARRAYHDETLSFWLKQIATECTLKLLTAVQYERDTHFIEHNIHALNWADTQTLISVGVQGVTNGIWSPDEVRRWFNYSAWPGGIGEKPFQPMNMQLLGEEPEPEPEPEPMPEPEDDDEEEETEDEGDTDGDGTANDQQ
jgi:HK97 family phage portal protein